MHIPVRHYEKVVRGSAVRVVLCENCQTEFVYVVSRQGHGDGVSILFLDNKGAQDRARTQAGADLQRELTRGQDPIPCPDCGWYQRSMIPFLRQAHRRGMGIAGALLLCLAAHLLVFSVGAWFGDGPAYKDLAHFLAHACGWLTSVGLGLILIRKLLAGRIRPNEGDPEARKDLGRRLAMRMDDFKRALDAKAE